MGIAFLADTKPEDHQFYSRETRSPLCVRREETLVKVGVQIQDGCNKIQGVLLSYTCEFLFMSNKKFCAKKKSPKDNNVGVRKLEKAILRKKAGQKREI